MTTSSVSAVVNTQPQFGYHEIALVQGDLAHLSPEDRTAYYMKVCQSLGLNHLTKPFEYIMFQGKVTLYTTRSATDQIRSLRGVSVVKIEKDFDKELGLLNVTCYVKDQSGREDSAIASIAIGTNMRGDALANALMKCETKAKRRATLSLCGLSIFENEPGDFDAMGGATMVNFDKLQDLRNEIIKMCYEKNIPLMQVVNSYGKNNIEDLQEDELKKAAARLRQSQPRLEETPKSTEESNEAPWTEQDTPTPAATKRGRPSKNEATEATLL